MLDIQPPLDAALNAWPMLGCLLRQHNESCGATQRKDLALTARPDKVCDGIHQ
jgi:hypothetical protein